MKILNKKDFREFKKLAIGLTHKLEEFVDLFEQVVNMRAKFLDEEMELSEKQIEELEEYENRTQDCLDYFDNY